MQNTIHARLIAGILAPLVLGGFVAGCGDGDGDRTSSAGGGAASTPTQVTTPRPAGDAEAVDAAFVRQMVPHHEMAVEMAEQARKSAEHQEVKELADEIIATQTKEISALEAIAKELGVAPAKAMGGGVSMDHGEMADDAKTLGLTMPQMGMSMDMGSLERADRFDEAFIDEMTVHHQGAIAMAKAQLAGGENAELNAISKAIIAAQEQELAEMANWKADWYAAGAGASDPSAGEMHEDMPGMSH